MIVYNLQKSLCVIVAIAIFAFNVELVHGHIRQAHKWSACGLRILCWRNYIYSAGGTTYTLLEELHIFCWRNLILEVG